MSRYQKTLFIFRRDLRLEDNTALIAALENSASVIPCFIVDPRQVGDQPYRSDTCLEFMSESLQDLDQQLKAAGSCLYLFEGKAGSVVEELIKVERIEAVYFNQDYTPFSRTRDEQIAKRCMQANIPLVTFHDVMLNPPQAVLKNDGGVYTVYTPYCRKAMTLPVAEPRVNRLKNYYQGTIKLQNRSFLDTRLKKVGLYPGGRQAARKILQDMSLFKNYQQERDLPHLQATSKLSPHHKFGTVSIREVYHAVRKALGVDHTLIRELYWRDFFTQIGYHFPHVLGQSFHKKFDAVKWEQHQKLFETWCEGRTGFPIVDAGMRELNETGFMHNRVRMITASFLIKDLHIDWRLGEKYFATKLVDYDPLVNNGNWQWVASTGCDAQPYFRVFNPWLQQEKFDPQALYIRRWIPELRSVSLKDIHHRDKTGSQIKDYPSPIVWHDEEKAKALRMYKVIQA